MNKTSTAYIEDIKEQLQNANQKQLLDAAIKIEKLQCENNKLEEELRKKQQKPSWFGANEYFFTLVFIALLLGGSVYYNNTSVLNKQYENISSTLDKIEQKI